MWREDLVDIEFKTGTWVWDLIIDNNDRPNIFYMHTEAHGIYDLMHGYKINGIWHRDTIHSKGFLYYPKFKKTGNEIWGFYQNEDCDIVFTKTDFVQSVEDFNIEGGLHLNCYPNPFSKEIKISYNLISKTEKIECVIYSLQGHKIDEMINLPNTPGKYSFTWQSKDLMSDGIYIIQLNTTKQKISKRIIKSHYY